MGVNGLRVYVAAPYDDSSTVREIHRKLRDHGLRPSSSWAETAKGAEELGGLSISFIRAIASQNDNDVLSSDAVLVIARAGAGGEMFAEARLALVYRIPVFWVGALVTLTGYRKGVTCCTDVAQAISFIRDENGLRFED